MENKLKSIRHQSETYPRLTTLMNRVNVTSLMMAHWDQDAHKASGIDDVTKAEYSERALDNVRDLIQRMKSFKYVPKPVRRTYIPKLNGKLRPLGIPAYEDKLVQKVMGDILIEVYEPRFLECSYGFRPNRSAHDVVRYITNIARNKKVNYILDADIKGFFDNLDQKWLMKFLEHDIADRNFLRYIARFLKAGIMEDGELKPSEKGAPQGGLISPVLSNVYLHYVLDLWVEKVAKKQCCGEMYYVRYADDFLVMFRYNCDAVSFLKWLKERFSKFGLELAEDKTRILPFGKYQCAKKETFDFLGFTFFNARAKKSGSYRVGVKSSAKKMKAKRQELRAWIEKRLQVPVVELLIALNRKLVGHYQYYGVNGNSKELSKYEQYALLCTWRTLRKRTQRKKIKLKRLAELWRRFVTRPTIRVQIW